MPFTKILTNLFILVGTILVIGGTTNSSKAADLNSYVGVLLGAGVVNNSGGTNFTYGVEGGYKFDPKWSAGAELGYNSFTVPSPLSGNLTLVLANIEYYFGSGFYGGLKMGSGTLGYSGTGAPGGSTNLAWGPAIGYDYGLNEKITAGGEANLIWINNTNPGVSVFRVLADLKYWF